MISRSTFDTAIVPFTLKYEGGYANVKGDAGGETYRGITRRDNPGWTGWRIIDRLKPKHDQIIPGLEPDVKKLYWDKYFFSQGFHLLNDSKIALSLFDFRVNGGLSASKIQTLLKSKYSKKIAQTGRFDLATVQAINSLNPDSFISDVMAQRKAHYEAIIRKKPSQKKFEKGWFLRLAALKGTLLKNAIAISGVTLLIVAVIIYFIFFKKEQEQEPFRWTEY